MDTAASAQKTHLDILKLGVAEWNKWRVERTSIAPDLRGADLRNAGLAGADLRAANLRGADLREANLRGANLKAADLRAADLKGAVLWSASLTGADLRAADLTGADLRGVNFRAANLMNAVLVDVVTNDYTDFRHATVTGARLWEDGEPVAESWETDVATTADDNTVKAFVKIGFRDQIGASECAAVLSLLDTGFFEYERAFIASLRGAVGGALADACLHRLEAERRQLVRLTRFEPGSLSMEAVVAPMGFRLLGGAIFSDVDDIWKRLTAGGAIKKALVNRAGRAAEEMQRLLRTAMAQFENLSRFELTVKAVPAPQRAPALAIGLSLREAQTNSPLPPAHRQTPSP
jgi:uncharacterized protein YjbI with pentapeptide repeats